MTDILIRGATIWDATGADPFPGSVVVRGNRIRAVVPGTEAPPAEGCEVIEAEGRTLMPGMAEGHAHLSFVGISANHQLGEIPVEEHAFATARNAELLLDHGFTSAYSAASAKLRLDIVVRDEIAAGRLKGPRIKASTPEITVTGGLGDENRAHLERSSFGITVDGPDAIRHIVRFCVREGVDNVKINISGDDFVEPAKGGMTVMSLEECKAAVETAHDFGKRIACHARAGRSVHRALDAGVDVIYHCEWADEQALDRMEAAKDRIFVGPAIGLIHNTIHEAGPWGITPEIARDLGMNACMERSIETYNEIRRRGIRTVIGGDYGFAWTPQGTNARDIAHFVDKFGYAPGEALQCATRVGGEIMGMGDELGQVREGYLADLLLVDGDPLEDVSILQDRDRLVMIMKDGALHKAARPVDAGRVLSPAAE
ncbi:MAG: amidohydrolase family protein [Azospirillaceae bacterium]